MRHHLIDQASWDRYPVRLTAYGLTVDDPDAALRIALRRERRGTRQPRLRVEGLAALGLHEIEGQATFSDISRLGKAAIALANYLIETGEAVQHGDTFGPRETTRFRVKLLPSFDDPTRVVYRIALPKPPELGPKRYYRFGIDYRGNPDTTTWVNTKTSYRGDPMRFGPRRVKSWDDHDPDRPAWDFPELVETPRILWDRRKGVFRDLIGATTTMFIISAATKRVFEAVHPRAFAFLACESVLPDGSAGPETETWLCIVTRTLFGAIDIGRSEGVAEGRFGRGYSLDWQSKIYFRPEVVGDSHVFAVEQVGMDGFCDDVFRDACQAARLKGIAFTKLF